MAIRNIRTYGDSCLNKECKPIKEMNHKLQVLIEDMLDTMYEANGVGLAAPQVGILKQVVVIDVSPEGDSPLILINPEIIETDGSQTGEEMPFHALFPSVCPAELPPQLPHALNSAHSLTLLPQFPAFP